MALDYCESCGSVEGGWTIGSAEEVNKEFGTEYKTDDDVEDNRENYHCDQCGSLGSWVGVPEHDDWDMER